MALLTVKNGFLIAILLIIWNIVILYIGILSIIVEPMSVWGYLFFFMGLLVDFLILSCSVRVHRHSYSRVP
ncbi:MAG: hypothetical protein KAR08_07815 [Candidatus Heimdallarchaeota archaeon]|nr:hypothetical protein [Candidatus Heimdallarchaeota archaeon]MCK5185213.1 hypothetical protein [Candidatus Heimdallarchaeota archaeon]